MADIELLPLVGTLAFFLPEHHREVVQSYARANVEHHTAKLRAEIERLVEALQSVERYGADTLSGPTTDTDDRIWYRSGVVEMTRRAQAALRDHEQEAPQ